MKKKELKNTTVIRPKKNIFDKEDFKDIWRFKDLFYVLTERDVKIKYKQTLFGVAWVLFQPLISTIIFTLLFSRFPAFPTRGLPYPIFAFIGLTYWTYFSNALTSISGSVQGSEGIIKKVYFPRIISPLSTLAANAVDFLVSSSVFLLFLLIFRVAPSIPFILVYLLGFIVITITIFGMGLFLSALNVKYRDIRFVLPFFIQILIFLTPVFYPLSIVSKTSRLIFALNPLTTIIETCRIVLSRSNELNYLEWGISLMSMSVALFFGYVYFKKTEKHLSDLL